MYARSRQTVHFEQEAARQHTRRRVARHIARNVAVEYLTRCAGVFADLQSGKERSRYVMQTKRKYQQRLDKTVQILNATTGTLDSRPPRERPIAVPIGGHTKDANCPNAAAAPAPRNDRHEPLQVRKEAQIPGSLIR